MTDDRPIPERAASSATLAADRFADVAGSLGDVVGEVVAQFHELGLAGAAEIERASEAADQAGVRSAAHQLKGMSMTLGADRLRDLCAEIERASGSGSQIGADAVAEIRREIKAAHDAMRSAMPVDSSAG